MTPALLLPGALAALAAWAIPLLIHLARRSEARPTAFAALRWLTPRPRPRSRLRFDDWPLLLVRLILLALIALWLAGPALYGAAATTPWVAIVPGVDVARVTASGERHWLAPGFPPLDRPAPAGPVPVASLLRALDATLPPKVALTVIVPAVIDGDGERPRLSRRVDWRIGSGAMPARSAATPPPILPLIVRYAASEAAGLRYLQAAATAWQPPGTAAMFDAAPAGAALPSGRGALVWLVPGPLPGAMRDWIGGGRTALLGVTTTGVTTIGVLAATVIERDAVGAPLATAAALGRGRVIQLTRPLQPDVMPELLDPGFATRLRTLLTAPPPAPIRVSAAAYEPLTGGAAYPQPARDLQPWLALVIAGVWLIERWLATARRRVAR